MESRVDEHQGALDELGSILKKQEAWERRKVNQDFPREDAALLH